MNMVFAGLKRSQTRLLLKHTVDHCISQNLDQNRSRQVGKIVALCFN